MEIERALVRQSWGTWLAMLAVLAAIPALIENGDNLPIDSHEAFVARTAEEMTRRGQWLVPWFNGEVRLQKPPLAYWAVMVVDRLGQGRGDVSDWEARIPSIVGGVLLVICTAELGRRMMGRRVGWLAGLLVAGSSGFLAYTHSARPEMLYAAFCTAALAFFAHALHEPADDRSPHRQRWLAWCGWSMMGLAVLTKGPQLPLLLVIGWTVGLFFAGYRGEIRRSLRPVAGVVLVAIIALWWYAAILLTVPGAIERWQVETLDRAIVTKSVWRWLQPYYFVRTPILIMPWALVFPLALILPWWRAPQTGARGTRVLWCVLVTCMLGLSLSAGRRWYYMLPAIAPLGVLIAQAMMRLGRTLLRGRRGITWRALAATHCLAFAAVAIGLSATTPGNEQTKWMMAIIAAAVGALTGAAVWRARPARPAAVGGTMALCALASIIMLSVMAESETFWRRRRFDEAAFALRVRQDVRQEEPMVSWLSAWEPGTYYTDRVIPVVRDSEALRAVVRANPARTIWIITQDGEELPGEFNAVPHRELREDATSRVRVWSLDASSRSAHGL